MVDEVKPMCSDSGGGTPAPEEPAPEDGGEAPAEGADGEAPAEGEAPAPAEGGE